ncbi:GPI transamidase component GAA1 [Golovinomyces cichoracearum]|uniref:GPI transamidase component GAA1 n=1 Tax=Golovinomyces cichoracearum TaxID=62708 RepID=A0A420H9T3_9PEZI|nr:GPI transamidase component GAA1 [Golovinomyces cichoracearum]
MIKEQLICLNAVVASGVSIRRNSLLLKLPPYLSLLCVIIGVAWLLTLPLDDYSRRTYISENALLPGQVHTYFAGSDQNIFRGYKFEVDALESKQNNEVNDKLEEFLKASGLKVGRQSYSYQSAGETFSGENIYAILHAPRGDATEAIVLVGAWKNLDGELNRSGIALILTLARYFKRWSLWSKDIIFLITPESKAGPQAWVDAYHDTHQSPEIQSLPLKSGALQGAIVIDYPFSHRFESIHIVYDGINGQLPNLDLINTVVSIASSQMGIRVCLQSMWQHTDNYQDRLQTMLRGMLSQGLGHASGPHSSFIPYHIDAITIQPFGHGWQDEMAIGRVIESTFRSLNNLLEHLHQSFFLYLLMQANRFVSIGTYLPSAMLVALNFTIMAVFLWVKSGSLDLHTQEISIGQDKKPQGFEERNKVNSVDNVMPVRERELFLPLIIVVSIHFLGALPLYIFNKTPKVYLSPTFLVFIIFNTSLPFLVSSSLTHYFSPSSQQYQLIKCFSLLLLGLFLSSLATLNFSLSLLVGLLSAPLAYTQHLPNSTSRSLILPLLLNLLAPTTVLIIGTWYWGLTIEALLTEAAFGWNVWWMNTQFVVWCVWWPAWLVGMITLLGGKNKNEQDRNEKKKIE